MHELAIAEAIIGIASEHAGGRRVTRVEVKVGHLRQVVPSALEFCFEIAAQGSVAEGAVLAIEEVPAVARCRACGTDTPLATPPLHCGGCGGWDLDFTSGRELLVDALEVDEEEVGAR